MANPGEGVAASSVALPQTAAVAPARLLLVWTALLLARRRLPQNKGGGRG